MPWQIHVIPPPRGQPYLNKSEPRRFPDDRIAHHHHITLLAKVTPNVAIDRGCVKKQQVQIEQNIWEDKRTVMSLVPWYDSIPFYFHILVFPLWRWLTMMHGTDVMPHVSCTSLCDCSRSMLDFSLSLYCLWHLYSVMSRRWTNDH